MGNGVADKKQQGVFCCSDTSEIYATCLSCTVNKQVGKSSVVFKEAFCVLCLSKCESTFPLENIHIIQNMHMLTVQVFVLLIKALCVIGVFISPLFNAVQPL